MVWNRVAISSSFGATIALVYQREGEEEPGTPGRGRRGRAVGWAGPKQPGGGLLGASSVAPVDQVLLPPLRSLFGSPWGLNRCLYRLQAKRL
jgi:hypothetical protein